ncbi:MAG: amino acid adenylation domain-containing protein [Chlamydiae bacterium]|nr:amino acid adenylation domain-containing protein [Chlamydiota bacterium]
MHAPTKNIAIESNHGVVSQTELEDLSNQYANFFLSIGIKNGDRIGLFLHRSVEFVVCTLASSKIGAIYVPIDPTYPNERKKFIIVENLPDHLLSKEIKKTAKLL